MNRPLCLILLLFLFILEGRNSLVAQVKRTYVGTYTNNSESKGVYVYDYNPQEQSMTFVKTIEMSNPSFLTRREHLLYAVNEDVEGMLTVYDLSSEKVVNQVPTQGMHPCHVALSSSLPVAVVSNYSSGSLILYSLKDDGSIRGIDDFLTLQGSSIDKLRQKQSHIHAAFFTKDGKRIFVSDLGADLIYIYRIEKNREKYTLVREGQIKTKQGGGPRHLAFSIDERTIYTVLELTGELQVFDYDGSRWNSIQVIPLYKKGFQGQQGGGDVKVSKDGKFVYATNRGEANYLGAFKLKK